MATEVPGAAAAGVPRALPRRASLPTGRALVGGLLVALAMLGVLLTLAAGRSRPSDRFVVARTSLAVGSVLTAADVALQPMDLPPALGSRRAFRDPHRLVGAVVVAPVAAGELVQASAVADKAPSADREMAVRVARSDAVNGRIRAGDRVDVAATFGSGSDAYTAFVVRDAEVIARDQPGGALGDRDHEVLTLALASPADALAVAHAVAAGEVSVVRSTGGQPAGTEPYRAPEARRASPGGATDGR